MDVHVRRLREKIEPSPSEPKYVHTKWGVGVLFQSLAVLNIEGGAGKGKKPALLKSLPQCRLFEDHMERRKSGLNGESGGMKMDNIRIRQADMDDLDGVTLGEAR